MRYKNFCTTLFWKCEEFLENQDERKLLLSVYREIICYFERAEERVGKLCAMRHRLNL
jgi:hypothetical protein